LAKKQPPGDFDPHPGDPWHPEWTPDGGRTEAEIEEAKDSWWRRALGFRGEAPGSLPEAYAELEAVAEPRGEAGVDDGELIADALAAAQEELESVEGIVPVEETSVAAVAADTARYAARLASDNALAAAEAVAHEESRMWIAVGMARAEEDALSAAAARIAQREAERQEALEAWAAEALAIEEARLRMEEARKRTEAEVRVTLDKAVGSKATVLEAEVDAEEVALRFAAIAAGLEESSQVDSERRTRREQLRLRTSLLVLDAEQPWDHGGWSRPGASFRSTGGPPGTVMLAQYVPPLASITAGSTVAVPESAPRRRWPWSRKHSIPAAPDGLQSSSQSVVVIEERSVSGREQETGDGEQGRLPLEGSDAPDAEESPDSLDADLAAWSDLDWDLSMDDTTPNGDSVSSDDDLSPDDDEVDDLDSPDDWEAFTAEQYVQAATHEYADLAAAMAAAEGEPLEQAAIAAGMPGMESSLVSLEDVVAAEGYDEADATPAGSDLAIRVLTAVGLVALFFASLTYEWSIGLLILVIMGVAAFEFTVALIADHRHPVGLFIYLGVIGALLGTWAYGPIAIPVAVAATVFVVVLFFGLVTGRQDPLVGLALTVMVVLWVGVFAALAMDIIGAEDFRWLVASLVVVVAAADVAQYFVGKRFGKRRLAPVVSPKKTVAGLAGGMVVALAVGYGLSFIAPFDAATGLVLGGALALSGPLGDLAVSVLKRSMGLKDMGTLLPGHGGVVDRIDAILFSLPAAWLVFSWAGLLV